MDQANFSTLTFVASSLMTSAIVAELPETLANKMLPANATVNWDQLSFTQRATIVLLAPQGPLYSGLASFTGGNSMQSFIKNGSFGHDAGVSFNNYLDTLGELNGFTADNAVKEARYAYSLWGIYAG